MGSVWSIRRASSADCDALIRLNASAMGARNWRAEDIRAVLADEIVNVLLAERPKCAPAGFAIWRAVKDEGEILQIGVRPEARRAGAGRALLLAIAGAARDDGASRLFLEVDAENEGGKALYQEMGFSVTGRRKRYYKDGADAEIMELAL